MFITKTITILPNILPTNPTITTVKLGKGTLSLIRIIPATGPNWEIYTKINYRESALWPLHEDEWIALERYPIEIHPNWNNWDGTYDVQVLLCSPTARFTHIVQYEFEIEEQETIAQAIMNLIARGFK